METRSVKFDENMKGITFMRNNAPEEDDIDIIIYTKSTENTKGREDR